MLSFVVVCALLLSPTTLFAATSTSWNFKTTNFKNLGTITSSITVDNLGLIATSAKPMSVNENSQTLSGTTYTHCLALGGSGSTSYRSVKVPVNGASTIKVTLMSSGSSSRNLIVANSSGSKLTTLTAGTSLATQSYNYTGSKGYIYLYSAGSGINIFKIQVDDNSSSSSTDDNNNNNNNTSDSSNTIVVSNGGTSLASAIAKAKSGTTIIVNGTVKSDSV